MNLRKRAAIGSALAVLVFVVFTLTRPAPDPVVEGRPVSAWVGDLLSTDHIVRWEAQRVLIDLGEPGVPKIRELLLRRKVWQCPESLKGLATLFPFLNRSSVDTALYRMRGAEVLTLLGPKAVPAAPDLVNSLRFAQAATEAKRALERIGSGAVPAIVKGLRSRNKEVRMHSARLLRESAGQDLATCAALLDALRDREVTVRREAAASLGHAAMPNKAVIAALLEGSSDPAAEVRAACLEALGNHRQSSAAILTRLKVGMEDAIPLVRLEAAKAYWAVTHDSDLTVRVLSTVLPTQEGWQAAYALAAIGPEAASAIPALIEVLKREKVPRAFRTPPSSSFALGQMREAAIPALESVLSHPEPAVRIAALLALGFMGEHARSAVPRIMPLLHDREPEIRQVAAITLAGAGGDREVVLPPLVECLQAEDIYVRSTAAALLRQIAPERDWAIASE